MLKEDFDYKALKGQGTGNKDILEETKVVVIPFDKYLIKVRLSVSNVLLDIEEVTVNKNFLSHSQRLSALSEQGYLDVEKYYQQEEDQ